MKRLNFLIVNKLPLNQFLFAVNVYDVADVLFDEIIPRWLACKMITAPEAKEMRQIGGRPDEVILSDSDETICDFDLIVGESQCDSVNPKSTVIEQLVPSENIMEIEHNYFAKPS